MSLNEPALHSPRGQQTSSRRILIVDDSPVVHAQVGAPLVEAGFRTSCASDGLDALWQLEKHSDVALIVCDIAMPRMNGLELLQELRTQRIKLPTLILTTEGQRAMVERARFLGAKGWVLKPFKPNLLVASIRHVLRLVSSA